MHIKKIISQNRRDFIAIFTCEHCGHKYKSGGYDDKYYHTKVLPDFTCPNCGKKASANYKPRKPKYPEGYQI